MRAVVQRVSSGSVSVGGAVVSRIGHGLVILLGIARDDSPEDVGYMVEKTAGLRVFEDDDGKMNLSLRDVGGEALVVSQFTLYGDVRKGKRPSFSEAAGAELAVGLYESFVAGLRQQGIPVGTGIFQAMMDVEIHNDGPVTILLDSRKVF